MPFDLTFKDLPEREIQYNARASVSDFPAEMRAYEALAQASKLACPAILDLHYGMGAAERLDIFPVTAARQPAPLFVFIHGGYWRALRKEEAPSMAKVLTDAGVAVATLEYTLLPEATLAEVVREIRSAIAWLYVNGAHYGIDAQRIFVGGSSAGAHLAGMLLDEQWQAKYGVPQDVIKGMLGLSGLYDLRMLCDLSVNEWMCLHEEQAARLSPALRVPKKGPPLLLCVGGLETTGFKNQTLDFHAKWCAEGLPARLIDDAGCNHFNLVNELARADSPLTRATLEMILGHA